MTNSTDLTFQNTHFNLIDKDNQVWLSASDIAQALGYASSKSVSNNFNRNKDEFTTDMFEVINVVTSGNLKKSELIFSLRGAHLITMFSRTEKAKEFRKWVLDVLDKQLQSSPKDSLEELRSNSVRLLMVMESGVVVSSQVVPNDCCVFGLTEIPKLLKEPGLFSVKTLLEVGKVATERAYELSQY